MILRCSCEQARREAKAEAWEEAAVWHDEEAAEDERAGFPGRADEHHQAAYHFRRLAAAQRRPEARVPYREIDAPAMTWGPGEDGGIDG